MDETTNMQMGQQGGTDGRPFQERSDREEKELPGNPSSMCVRDLVSMPDVRLCMLSSRQGKEKRIPDGNTHITKRHRQGACAA